MKNTDSDTSDSVVIHDCSSRRQFIRTGTAFLLVGGSVGFTQGARANECDRAPSEKNPEHAGSDSDSGSGSDPEGCGRQRDKPKITHYRHSTQPEKTVDVVKVKA